MSYVRWLHGSCFALQYAPHPVKEGYPLSLSRHTDAPATRLPAPQFAATWLKAVICFAGLSVLAYGLAVCVSTPWGTQPWDVLHLGITLHTGLTLGRVSQLMGGLVVLITLLLRGKGITLVTLINILYIGFLLDKLLPYVPYVKGIAGLLYLEFGVIITSLGTAMYLAPNWGAGPRDSLMLALGQRLHVPIGPIRIVIDISVVLMGWLLGGPVGLGTLLAAITTGPWTQFFLRIITTMQQRLVKKLERV
jgi:uncharacterized membrane protein YczE